MEARPHLKDSKAVGGAGTGLMGDEARVTDWI